MDDLVVVSIPEVVTLSDPPSDAAEVVTRVREVALEPEIGGSEADEKPEKFGVDEGYAAADVVVVSTLPTPFSPEVETGNTDVPT